MKWPFRLEFLPFLVMFFLSACSETDSKVSSLTDLQKQALKETLASLGRATDTAEEGFRNSLGGRTLDEEPPHSAMVSRLHVDSCQFEAPLDTSLLDIRFKILGDQCPINARFLVHIFEGKNQIRGTSDVDYVVKDSKYKSLNDVDAYSIQSSWSMTGSFLDPQSGISLTGEGKGVVQSQKHGSLSLYLSASGRADKMEVVTRVSFPDFVAELKHSLMVEPGKPPVSEYQLNDQTLTKEEYESFLRVSGKTLRLGPPPFSSMVHQAQKSLP